MANPKLNGKNNISGANIKSTMPTMIVPKHIASHETSNIIHPIIIAAPIIDLKIHILFLFNKLFYQ